MPKNWKTYKLEDLGTIVTGKTPSSKHPEHFGNHLPFVTPTDFSDYHKNVRFASRYLSTEGAKIFKSKILPPNSILVTCIGSQMGKVVVNKTEVLTNQQLNSIIPNKSTNSDYLYYKLSSIHEQLRTMAGAGSTMPMLNKSDFGKIEIEIPEIQEQKSIASILSALDDKIELNLQMNKTLEEMAETLFEQWFFEEAKEEWETFKLESLIEIKGGFSYKGKYIGDGDSLLLGMGCVSFSDRFLQSGARKYSGECNANHLVKPGDLVIATRQQSDNLPILGAPASIPNSLQGKKVIVGTNLYRVNNLSFFSNNLLFQLLRSSAYQNHIKANSKGTTVRMITKDAVELFEFKIPPKSLLEEYDRKITALSDQIEHNNLENQTLTQLRDTLLPKLISGEVRVKDAEKTLSEVL